MERIIVRTVDILILKIRKLIMNKIIIITFACLFGSIASAGTIDFRTSPYATTFQGIANPNGNVTTDSVDGVNFTITATARGADGFRQGTDGLNFGVSGNGMYSLSIIADADIEYSSLTAKGHTLTQFAGQLPFDLSVSGALQVDNLMFGPSSFSTELLSILVSAGDAFLIDIDYSALVGSSIYSLAKLQSLNFTASSVSAVPLPAAVWLFGSALGFMGFFRKKKTLA